MNRLVIANAEETVVINVFSALCDRMKLVSVVYDTDALSYCILISPILRHAYYYFYLALTGDTIQAKSKSPPFIFCSFCHSY